jgi:hypothetical protein
MDASPAAPWLAANLEALAAVLGTEIALTGGGPWLATAAPDGITLQLRTAGGALVAAHSRRQPAAEATRVVDTALAGRACPPLVLVIGAGLGGVVEDLVRRDATVRVLVVEPDGSGAAAFLGHRDWTTLIRERRLLVLSGPEFRGVEGAWRFVPSGEAAPVIVVHPVLAREYPDDVRRAAAVGMRVLGDARANAGAENALAGPYLLNTIENLGVIAHEGDVDALAGAFEGVPAIVVAAGPSLDCVVADLVRLQDRALVIAVDTALRPLLAQGVVPHLGVAVDPSERNARHLTALDGVDGTWFVAEPSVHPSAFPTFAGRTFTFRVGDNHPWPWLSSLGVTRGMLAAWGSVLVSALDLAVRVGAEPIAIVGADLAYTGGQPYCRGTAFEEDWAREIRKGERLVDVWHRVAARPGAHERPDVDGRPTPTLPHLVAFRDRLLEQIATSSRRIVNATGGGILHGGAMELASLEAVLGDAVTANDLRARIRDRHRPSQRDAPALAVALAGSDAAPMLAATVPTVDGDRVASSVAAARVAIAGPPTVAPPARPVAPTLDAPIWWPEQTAALAALEDAPAAALAPLAESATRGVELDEVFDAARGLLAHEPLIVAPLDPKAVARDFLALPLPLLLPFAPDARADAARFAAALTRWLEAHRGTASGAEPAFWSVSPQSFDDSFPVPEGAAADGLARLTIGAALGAAIGRGGRAMPMLSRVAATAIRSWPRTIAEAPRFARVSLAMTGPGGERTRWLDDLALAPLSRALTGTLIQVGGRADVDSGVDGPWLIVSLILDASDVWSPAGDANATPARLLTPAPCAPCLFGAALDDEHAVVSRQDLGGSYIIDADGAVSVAAPWPVPILAEAPWGTDGRSYGWTSRPGRLLVRDAGGKVTHDVALPFTPSGAEPVGETLRFTALDGLWQWTSEGGPVRVIETPPLVFAMAVDAENLQLAPLPAERSEHRRTRSLLSWSAASGLQDAPVSPLGPCWSRSMRGGWIAEAFPEANLVRVSAGGGVRGWVIADRPRTVAWAGGSLVLVLAGGHVVFVPHARAALG